MNAGGLGSDAAVVGLQAMHMLRGEVDRFLWGAGYQGSFDSAVVALFFKLFGVSPLALMWAPLTGHLLLVVFAFLTIARRVTSSGSAFLLCLVLTFTPQAINGVVLAPPRQWCVTAVFFAVWLIDGGARWRPARFFVGALVAWLSTFLDLFGLLLAVPFMVWLVVLALDAPARRWLIGAGFAGALVGWLVVAWLRAVPGAVNASPTGLALTPARLAQTFPLLVEQCLPWVLGAKVWAPGANLYPDLWVPPWPVSLVQYVAASVFLLLVLGAPLWLRSPRVSWSARALGVFGALGGAACIAGFLMSNRPSDMWAARYLAPLVWLAPFALVPWAQALRPRGLAVLLVPYLVVAAVGGWRSFGTFVDGPVPRVDARGSAQEEMRLAEALRARGVEVAHAQYWLAYRLTFLWQEQPIVLSLDEDRYPPYRAQTAGAKVTAWLFHPTEPRSKPEDVLATLEGPVERLELEGFTVLLQRP